MSIDGDFIRTCETVVDQLHAHIHDGTNPHLTGLVDFADILRAAANLIEHERRFADACLWGTSTAGLITDEHRDAIDQLDELLNPST